MNASVDSQQSGQPVHPNRTRLRKRRGVALILVVSFIVLLSALVVGFFSRVSTDLAGARSYAEGINVRQLADSAVGVVMGQIRSATSVPNGCWASQPGMIRVYGSGTQAGAQAYAFYKLYSSHNLVVSGADLQQFDPTLTTPSSGANAEVPLGTGGWTKQPAFFTDINDPVDVPDPTAGPGNQATVKRYPIFDPSVARIQISPLNQNPSTNPATWVEGCEIVSSGSSPVPGSELVDSSGKLAHAPMPVRWLYVLKDGTLTAPTPLSGIAGGKAGLTATWNAAGIDGTPTGVPTKDNPIVGRIAFWADDDTCKVNINTAGGYLLSNPTSEDNPVYSQSNGNISASNAAFYAGSFWDTPRVQTTFDRGFSGDPSSYRPGLANSQPVRNEFQRYPGHPSTTSLALIFKYLLPAGTGFNSEKLYTMTPRLMPGASQGGTKQLLQYGANVDPTVYGIIPDPPSTIKKTFDPLKPNDPSYHLLSSVDELLYTTQNNATDSNGLRKTAQLALGLTPNSLTPRLVDQARFFLTAHSRSPELNLMGRPRVSVWPTPTAASEGALRGTRDPDTGGIGIRNPSDDLLRFCSTVGGFQDPNHDLVHQLQVQDQNRQGEFIFDREDPYSSTKDFSRFQNHQIFTYLQSVTANTTGLIPGWGASFQGKYSQAPGGREQILTEIFDYIRSVNLKDTSRDQRIDKSQGRDVTKVDAKGNPPATVPRAEFLKKTARYAREGIVIPTHVKLSNGNVSGFGRFPTVSEVSLVFYHAGYIYRDGRSGQEDVEYNWTLLPLPGQPSDSVTWGKAPQKNVLVGKLMRAFLVIETFNPMAGYGPVTDMTMGNSSNAAFPSNQRIIHEITNLTGFQVITKNGTKPLQMGIGKNNTYRSSGSTWGGRNFGGTEGFFHTLQDKTSNVLALQPYPLTGPATTYEKAGSLAAYSGPGGAYYPFQTPCAHKMDGIRLGTDEEETTFGFTGGTMTLQIHYVDSLHPYNNNSNNPNTSLIQTLTLTWPPGQGWPVPITEREARAQNAPGTGFRLDAGGFVPTVGGWASAPNWDSDSGTANFLGTALYRWSEQGGYRMPFHLPLRIRWAAQHSWSPWYGAQGKPLPLNDSNGKQVANGLHYANRFLQILQPGDTIRSLVPGGGGTAAAPACDPRVVQLQANVTTFHAMPDYTSAVPRSQTLRLGYGGFYFDPTNKAWFPSYTATQPTTGSLFQLPGGVRYGGNSGPDLPKGVQAKRFDGGAADFDTGLGNFPDGAFCGKADEGNLARSWLDEYTKKWTYVEPYFSTWAYDSPGDTYFSPNRQIPSPVMFGSLPAPRTNDWSRNGWTTLLFCPNPAGTTPPHPGLQSPPDHLWLDLFNMPVVEPYAISEPFSTDGKVNLNYQMMPFCYIKRSTALRAALQPLRVTAIPSNFINPTTHELKYKVRVNQQTVLVNGVPTVRDVDNPENLRYLVDRDETLRAFDAFFDEYRGNPSKGFFKSATQICERYLYPKGRVLPGNAAITFQQGETPIKNWWLANALTGDNVREKPYSDLYPRITTKSNTYTVHYRVQTLRQRPYTGSPGGADAYYRTWDESRDQVLSEYRGNTTIERYLDPEDPRFQPTYTPPTPASPPKIDIYKDSLETAYRFRVIYNKRFSPW